MKFAITWTDRPGGSVVENAAAVARMLEVLGEWSPPGDQPLAVRRASRRVGRLRSARNRQLGRPRLGNFEFSPYLEFAVYPVLDIHEETGPLAAAAEFRKSIS